MISSATEEKSKRVEQEWKELLLEAKKIGLTTDEVRDFIKHNSTK